LQFIDLKTQQSAIRANLDRRIAAVLAHSQYIMGPEVADLEQTLAAYHSPTPTAPAFVAAPAANTPCTIEAYELDHDPLDD